MKKNLINKYLPMTETAYYILLSLNQKRHGYGIIKHVEEITNHKIIIGAGTIYGTLKKLEKDQLIQVIEENDRRKTYLITLEGKKILQLELTRLQELVANGKEFMNHEKTCI